MVRGFLQLSQLLALRAEGFLPFFCAVGVSNPPASLCWLQGSAEGSGRRLQLCPPVLQKLWEAERRILRAQWVLNAGRDQSGGLTIQ